MDDVLGIRQIEDWETTWITRDAETRIAAKGFLYSLDVKRIAYVLVAAGFGRTCVEFRVNRTRNVCGNEVEEDDVGKNEGRREGSEDKEKGV